MTEPQYFRGFERWARNSSVQIDIPKDHGVPLTLVLRAEQLKREAQDQADRKDDPLLAYDEVWCVLDVDEHPKLHEARQLANARGIELAISNPCFELWLLLHFRESPGAQHRHALQNMMKQFIVSYDKHLDFDLLSSGVVDATRLARRLADDAQEEGESGRNPTTGVYLLTDSIARRDPA